MFKVAGRVPRIPGDFLEPAYDYPKLLQGLQSVCLEPSQGCVVISGPPGCGKSTALASLLLNEGLAKYFAEKCQIKQSVWINCFNIVAEDLSALCYKMKDDEFEVTLFVLEDVYDVEIVKFFQKNFHYSPCCVVTRDPVPIMDFGLVRECGVFWIQRNPYLGIEAPLKPKLGRTLSEHFQFNFDRILKNDEERNFFYAFLLFKPNEPVEAADLAILWDMEQYWKAEGICLRFEQRSMICRSHQLNSYFVDELFHQAGIDSAEKHLPKVFLDSNFVQNQLNGCTLLVALKYGILKNRNSNASELIALQRMLRKADGLNRSCLKQKLCTVITNLCQLSNKLR